jgi:hypothetical protein
MIKRRSERRIQEGGETVSRPGADGALSILEQGAGSSDPF